MLLSPEISKLQVVGEKAKKIFLYILTGEMYDQQTTTKYKTAERAYSGDSATSGWSVNKMYQKITTQLPFISIKFSRLLIQNLCRIA